MSRVPANRMCMEDTATLFALSERHAGYERTLRGALAQIERSAHDIRITLAEMQHDGRTLARLVAERESEAKAVKLRADFAELAASLAEGSANR